MKDSICIKGVTFKRINEDLFKEIGPKTILFFMISQSGLVDRRGTIYVFTKSAAFFMEAEQSCPPDRPCRRPWQHRTGKRERRCGCPCR